MTNTASTTFAHPGLLNSQARLHDFASKANSAEPSAIKAGYEAMLKEKYASLDYPFQPYAIIEVLPGELTPTEKQFKEDSAAAYVLALRWVQSNDPRYRDRAIEILDGWASTYQRMNSPKSTVQPQLESAWSAPVWANAAEIIKHHAQGAAGWPADKVAQFNRFLDKLYVEAEKAKGRTDSNWGASAGLAMISVGVFQDNRARYDAGVEVIKTAMPRLILSGSGRLTELDGRQDCHHPQYTLSAFVEAAETVYNQGSPELYEAKFKNDVRPRLSMGLQYMARTVLTGEGFDCSHTKLSTYSELAVRYYQGQNLQLPDLFLAAGVRPLRFLKEFPIWGHVTHGNDRTSADLAKQPAATA